MGVCRGSSGGSESHRVSYLEPRFQDEAAEGERGARPVVKLTADHSPLFLRARPLPLAGPAVKAQAHPFQAKPDAIMKWARRLGVKRKRGFCPAKRVHLQMANRSGLQTQWRNSIPQTPSRQCLTHLPVSMPPPTRLPDAFCMAGVCSIVDLACSWSVQCWCLGRRRCAGRRHPQMVQAQAR